MITYIVLAVLVLLIVLAIIFHVIKVFFKVLSFFFVLFLIIAVVFSLLLTGEMKGMQDSESSFLLKDSSGIIAGFIINPSENEEINIIEELEGVNNAYKNNTLGSREQRVILVDIAVIRESEIESVEYDGIAVPKETALRILESDNALELFVSHYVREKNLDEAQRPGIAEQLKTDSTAKGIVFALFEKELFNSETLIYSLKKGDVEILPGKWLKMALKITPKFVIDIVMEYSKKESNLMTGMVIITE